MKLIKIIARVLFAMLGAAMVAFSTMTAIENSRNLGLIVRLCTFPAGLATGLLWSAGKLGHFPNLLQIALLTVNSLVLLGVVTSIIASGGMSLFSPFFLLMALMNCYIFYDLIKSLFSRSKERSK